jgi:hypothetical protein
MSPTQKRLWRQAKLRERRRFRWLLRKLHIGGNLQLSRASLSDIAQNPENAWFVERVTGHPLLGPLLRGPSFPVKPRYGGGGLSSRGSSLRGVLQYIAATLLPCVSSLRDFEKLRTDDIAQKTGEAVESPPIDRLDSTDATADDLAALKKFGFTIFATLWQLRTLQTGSEAQALAARKILDARPSPVVAFAVHKIYEYSSRTVTARQIADQVGASSYEATLKGFLLALLHPAPLLTHEQIVGALTFASHCPAIDQWIILIRCCQSLYAMGDENHLRGLPTLRKLLLQVPSIETARILSCALDQPTSSPTGPSSFEEGMLAAFFGGVARAESEDFISKNVLAALRTTGSTDRKLVIANLATLDRLATRIVGVRLASVIAAIGAQLSALSEFRAVVARRWIEISAHEAVSSEVSTRTLHDAIYRKESDVEISARLRSAVQLAQVGDWDAARLRVVDLADTSREAAAFTVESLLQTRRFADATLQAAKASVLFPSLLHRIPLDEILKNVPRSRPASVETCLAYATILDLGVRHLSTEYSRRRTYAVEDTLRVAGVEVPSSLLLHPVSSGTSPLLEHFLSTICIPSVMDTIPIGECSRELLEERIRILQGLRDRGGASCFELEEEIVQLTAEIAVAAERVTLDQQRVYVDVEGLTTRLAEDVRSDYELYQRLRALDPRRPATADVIRRVQEQFPDILVLDTEKILKELASEAAGHLRRIIKATRHEFALGEDHGLDGYLSGGIRHGNLEALLRQPFVAADILGTFQSGGNFVLPRSFVDNARHFAPSSLPQIEEALQKFASTFQRTVDSVLADWIQIRLDEQPEKAIFDFSLESSDIIVLQVLIGDARSVDECVSRCVDFWRKRMISNLETARDMIRGELRDSMQRAVDELTHALYAVGDPFLSVLVTNLPVRASLEVSLETLASWFEVGPSLDAGEIEPRLVISIAQSTITNLYPRAAFRWQVSTADEGVFFIRRSMKHWVDILLTLLHNVVRHSGQRDEIHVSVGLNANEDSVAIQVSNPLGANVSMPEIDRAIATVQEQIEACAYLPAVRREGRTGLMKVLKAAKIDLRADGAELKLCRIDQSFLVELQVPGSPYVKGGARESSAR